MPIQEHCCSYPVQCRTKQENSFRVQNKHCGAVSVLLRHGCAAATDAFDEALDLIDWIEDVAVTESPGGISSSAVPRGKLSLKFTDRFMRTSRNVLTGYEASEGALYVLFYTVPCLSPFSPSVIAVDNLDQAINPRLIQRVVARLPKWLHASNVDRQLIFTAHNPAVLDGLDLADDAVRLIAVDRDNTGQTTKGYALYPVSFH